MKNVSRYTHALKARKDRIQHTFGIISRFSGSAYTVNHSLILFWVVFLAAIGEREWLSKSDESCGQGPGSLTHAFRSYDSTGLLLLDNSTQVQYE